MPRIGVLLEAKKLCVHNTPRSCDLLRTAAGKQLGLHWRRGRVGSGQLWLLGPCPGPHAPLCWSSDSLVLPHPAISKLLNEAPGKRSKVP